MAKIRMQIGKVWIEVDSANVKEAMKGISDYAEVFAHTTCGNCGVDNVRPVHRVSKGYDFYEMFCLSCSARLGFGQTREGDRLFPKVKDQDGNVIGVNGWHKYLARGSGEAESF